MSHDPVNRPQHYTQGPVEVIEIIEGFGMNFHLGNVIKYVLRHDLKNGVEDLEKARWYLEREIKRRISTFTEPKELECYEQLAQGKCHEAENCEQVNKQLAAQKYARPLAETCPQSNIEDEGRQEDAKGV